MRRPRGHRPYTAAFTFIEVLFALFIAGLLALTVGYTLILSLRSEERGGAMREAATLLTSYQAGAKLELEDGDTAWAEHPDWRVTEESVIVGVNEEEERWREVRVTRARPEFRAAITLREKDP